MKEESKFGFHVGDILEGCVSHGFTTYYFYEVVGFTEKMVCLRELEKKYSFSPNFSHGCNDPYWFVFPDRGRYAGEVFRRRPLITQEGKPYIRTKSYLSSYPWDGKTKTEYSD